MKDKMQKLMVEVWEYGKKVIEIHPENKEQWREVYNLRQAICDSHSNNDDYILIRTMTNAFLDWYESSMRNNNGNS